MTDHGMGPYRGRHRLFEPEHPYRAQYRPRVDPDRSRSTPYNPYVARHEAMTGRLFAVSDYPHSMEVASG